MKFIPATLASFSIATGLASANLFAPKVSRNTREASYIGGLLEHAVPTSNSRRLDQEEIDISGYSIKFEKCQLVKQYAEEQYENADTVLETKRFVIFRLCPNHSCADCSEGYGEYIIDLESYLESTVQHKQEELENYCQSCEETCAAADDAVNNYNRKLTECDSCYRKCQNIENMEANGYADASEYTRCGEVYENENTGVAYYAGAVCTNSGSRIKVGLFTDENCENYDESAEIDHYLKNDDGYNIRLSYHVLKQTFPNDQCVASCLQEDEDGNGYAGTAEVCQNLYAGSGKCENSHGFVGMDYSNSEYYAVQKSNEDSVCNFVANIRAGHYAESGEVVVTGGMQKMNGNSRTTGGQKFFLSFFIMGSAGLAAYAALLHKKINQGRSAELSSQVGAMA